MSEPKSHRPVLWIDNDACPRRVREVIFKAAERTQIPVKIVANSYMKPPSGLMCEIIVAGSEFDAADHIIAEQVQEHDLVITADIPLADRVVEKGAIAISHKGEVFDRSSIKDKLAIRNLSQELRSAGSLSSGPAPYSDQDLKKFATAFDQHIQKLKKFLNKI